MLIPRRQFLAGAGALGLAGCGSGADFQPAQAQAPTPSPAGGPSRLFVLTCQGGSQTGDRLLLRGVSSSVVFFDDRPARQAGRQPTAEFIANWSAYGFAADPPNAVLQEEASHAFVLLSPSYDAATGTLTFQVRQDQGQAGGPAPPQFGAATLFIDDASPTVLVSGLFFLSADGLGDTVTISLTGQGGQAQFSLGPPFAGNTGQLFCTGTVVDVTVNPGFITLGGFAQQNVTRLDLPLAAQPGIQTVTFNVSAFGSGTIRYETSGGRSGRLEPSSSLVLPWSVL